MADVLISHTVQKVTDIEHGKDIGTIIALIDTLARSPDPTTSQLLD